MTLPHRLVIPHLKTEELELLLEAATGAEKDFLRLQSFAADIVQGIRAERATPADVALLALWSRAFRLVDSSRFAFANGDSFVLTLLDRSATEASLQVSTIAETFGDAGDPSDSDEVRERLHAFLAWTIWNDRAVDQSLLDHMGRYWSGEPTRRVLAAGESNALFERLGGSPEIANEHELERERAQQERKFISRIELKGRLLDDPALRPWTPRIQSLERKNGDPISFFELCSGVPGGVRATMKAMDLPHAHPIYAQASTEMHGSGVESLMFLTEVVGGPRLPRTRDDTEIETLAQGIRGTIAPQLIMIGALIRRFGRASDPHD